MSRASDFYMRFQTLFEDLRNQGRVERIQEASGGRAAVDKATPYHGEAFYCYQPVRPDVPAYFGLSVPRYLVQVNVLPHVVQGAGPEGDRIIEEFLRSNDA